MSDQDVPRNQGVLDFDTETVFQFVRSLVPGLPRFDGMTGIGLRKDGELVAGVIYEGFNGPNVWMHVAAVPGRSWLNRSYLTACFAYPFIQLGVERVSGYVYASNLDARRFDEHLGFEEEARLKGAAPDGGDVIIYVMWKEGCRYVNTQ
jgi:RimJ/RimL family protein N-acetyltransferase